MRLKRIEIIAIALTLAFACFLGGYYTGARGSVSIVAVEPQQGETLHISTGEANLRGSSVVMPSAAAETNGTYIPVPDETLSQPPGVESSELQPGEPRGGDGRININTASRSELMDLPGIGNVLAGRIVDYRSQYGTFTRIEDIKRVSGIGEKRFEAIQDKITVGN